MLAKKREQHLYSCRVVAPGTRFVVEVRRTLCLVPLPQSSQRQALRPGRLLLAQQLSQEHPSQALRLVSVPRPERRVIPAPSRYPSRPIKSPVPSLFKDPDPHPSFTQRARPPSMHLVPFVPPVSSRHGRLSSPSASNGPSVGNGIIDARALADNHIVCRDRRVGRSAARILGA